MNEFQQLYQTAQVHWREPVLFINRYTLDSSIEDQIKFEVLAFTPTGISLD